LKKWQKQFSQLKIINTENKNLAASRNIGIPHCSGDIILQTDDDARPFSNWVETMVETHKQFPNVGVIGGNVIDGSPKSFLASISDAITFPQYDSIKSVRSVPGVNSSYKKEVIKQVGEYDESLFRGEDVDYNWRVKLNGWDILFIPKIKVTHIHRPTWIGLFEQHFMYGRAHYLVRSKWPKMYSHYPIKIYSPKDLIKWFASWTITPFIDAFIKGSRINNSKNGFDVLILFFVNLSNRVGSFYQKYLVS